MVQFTRLNSYVTASVSQMRNLAPCSASRQLHYRLLSQCRQDLISKMLPNHLQTLPTLWNYWIRISVLISMSPRWFYCKVSDVKHYLFLPEFSYSQKLIIITICLIFPKQKGQCVIYVCLTQSDYHNTSHMVTTQHIFIKCIY